MRTNAVEPLVEVLTQARALLARPDNDFLWSPWEDAEEALREVDGLLASLSSGARPWREVRGELVLLFLPTGPLQEVSLSSGWGEEFLQLAERFDAVIEALDKA